MPNHLAGQTSPYLLQHADNPVDWHPWGEEALRLARTQDKPILLSIGYSACHWCHVMAYESFEDPEVAGVMNRLFVNIKVDREERPDLDQIYQTAHYLLTRRSGGWPLTMFLAPDQKPFFGGTYFPKTPRYNLPGFVELLEHVARVYREQGEAIAAQSEELTALLARTVPDAPLDPRELDEAPLVGALQELKDSFDPVHGGLGSAPKFPHPFELELCLTQGTLRADETARRVALVTLERMALGGIYDQLGGGFCRYSVDERWSIPHFEKMLYDNGPLLRLYADAWLVTRDPLFARVCRETAGWVVREMQSPQGGYYSSLDADSEHEEGKFYVWSRDEAACLMDADEYAVAAAVFGLDRAPNFEGTSWHLRIARPLHEVAVALGIDDEQARARLENANRKLFDARERRVRPGRDDKVLTSWNALMIEGMAHAGRVFAESAWLDSARRALDFVREALCHDGRLLATWKDGRAHLDAYLDDHAFLLGALLELLQAEFHAEDLAFARTLADALLERFADPVGGGFFFTSHDHEQLILRQKPGRAALALQRLGHLIGEPRYLDAAQRALRLHFPQMQRHPSGSSSLCLALAEHLQPPQVVVLRGDLTEARRWGQVVADHYYPHTLALVIGPQPGALPGALDKPLRPGVNAWVCRGVNCLPPITDLGMLRQALQPMT
jgi:uncharacterized protein YyaL (SSP411 family)